MSNFSKNNSNDLDKYDAEIVEDLPEQFDLSRYRKQKSMNFNRNLPNSFQQLSTSNEIRGQVSNSNGSNFILKPTPQLSQRYKNGGGNELLLDNRYPFAPTIDNPINYLVHNNRPDVIIDPNYLPTMQYSAFNQQQALKTRPQYHHQHQLPFITGTPLTPSNIVQAPVPQYPNQSQQHQKQSFIGSGIETYGLNMQTGYANVNPAFDSQNSDYKRKSNKNITEQYEASSAADDDEKYANTNSRRSKPKNADDNSNIGQYYDKKDRLSEFYTKEQQYLKKSQLNDLSPDSDSGSYYSEDSVKNVSQKISELAYNTISNSESNNTDSFALKSNLKPGKKHGVKFDEKLEVYEVNNPHYGSEVKSEKRELKKKKKDKKKEDDMLLKTKLDIKAKLQAQKAILFHVSMILNGLNFLFLSFFSAKTSITKTH